MIETGKKQIPFGNDRKKSKSRDKSRDKSKDRKRSKSKGRSRSFTVFRMTNF
jgi:hypothetical protein